MALNPDDVEWLDSEPPPNPPSGPGSHRRA